MRNVESLYLISTPVETEEVEGKGCGRKARTGTPSRTSRWYKRHLQVGQGANDSLKELILRPSAWEAVC